MRMLCKRTKCFMCQINRIIRTALEKAERRGGEEGKRGGGGEGGGGGNQDSC